MEAGRQLPAFFMSGLYFHIPFCRSKCPYCDFFSVDRQDGVPADYVDQMLVHLQREAGTGLWSEPFATVFFGGGTPSLLEPKEVERILAAVLRLFKVSEDVEISLEANPGTVDAERLAGFRSAGINRVNFGIQSLNTQHLRRLGRIHSADDARQVVRYARRAGFTNVGIDLMFALPGQSEADFIGELSEVLDLAPEHLSLYGLTIEETTPFYHWHRSGDLDLPDEETSRSMFVAADRMLTEAGFVHYEISNYARPGRECRHNLGYWGRHPCLGVGAGAHSLLDKEWGERWAVPGDLPAYAVALAGGEGPLRFLEDFDGRGAMAETLYLGLRTAMGVDEAAFRRRFGLGVAEAFPEGVRRAGERIRFEGGFWRLDLPGWLIFDHLIEPFL